MGRQPCDGCGQSVSIAGGIASFWSTTTDRTEGLSLELADGSDVFLCQECIERLPQDREPTGDDVAALPEAED